MRKTALFGLAASLFLLHGCSVKSDWGKLSKTSPVRVSGSNTEYLELLNDAWKARNAEGHEIKIETIIQVVDSNLMSSSESPLDEVLIHTAIPQVKWYGDIVVSNILYSSTIREPLGQTCNICKWMVLGLRREKHNECNIYAIEVERRLLQYFISDTNNNPVLESLFTTDHLSLTGLRLGGKTTDLKQHLPLSKNEEEIHKKILRMADHLLTEKTVDVNKLIKDARAMSSILKADPVTRYKNMMAIYIDAVLIPDFELHLLKDRFKQRAMKK